MEPAGVWGPWEGQQLLIRINCWTTSKICSSLWSTLMRHHFYPNFRCRFPTGNNPLPSEACSCEHPGQGRGFSIVWGHFCRAGLGGVPHGTFPSGCTCLAPLPAVSCLISSVRNSFGWCCLASLEVKMDLTQSLDSCVLNSLAVEPITKGFNFIP